MEADFNKEYKDFLVNSKVREKLTTKKFGNYKLYDRAIESIGEKDVQTIIIAILEVIILNGSTFSSPLYAKMDLLYLVDEESNSPEIFEIKKYYSGTKLSIIKEIKEAISLYFMTNADELMEFDKEFRNWPTQQKIIDLANKLDTYLPIKSENKKTKI